MTKRIYLSLLTVMMLIGMMSTAIFAADSEWYDASKTDFTISNADELFAFAEAANAGNNFEGKMINLTANIDLGGKTWTPISSFAGEFDGNDNIISNFHIDATAANGGFFNVIAAGEGERVHDLILSDVTATVGNKRFGTLANSIQGIVNRVTVKNITVTTTHTSAWVGGMCAFMSWPWMNDCTVENLTVNAENGADLIAGFSCILQKNSNMVFDNNDVKGFKVNVTDTDSSGCGVGGYVSQTQRGWENPKVINSDVIGIDITAAGLVDVGGFIAWPGAHTIAENCTTEGKIDSAGVTSADCFAGGFFGNLGWNCDLGQMGHVVTNCTADVDITTKIVPAGGFVGSATNSNDSSMYATFTNCSASGDITCVDGGNAYVGGFAGDADRGVYNNCSATGTVIAADGVSGGFIGYIADVNPKYDSRYPMGTRSYNVEQITLFNSTASSDPFIGGIAPVKPEAEVIIILPDLDFTNAVGDEFGEGYTWDHENKILTLDNINYSTNMERIIGVPDGSTIKIIGENIVESTASSITAIYIEGEAVIAGEGENASLTANGSIVTPDTVVDAGLTLVNIDVNIGRSSINIRNDNGTRGEEGIAGTASFIMENSSLYCGPVFVGAHLSSNHSYTRTSAIFSMADSSIDIQGGGKSAMIFVWGDCGVDFDVVDSNVKIWNSGWQQNDINIQGGNDHYGVTGEDGVVLDVNIERSNLDMYGYWSGLSVSRYYGNSADINFNMNESTVSTMTKYGSAGITIAESTETGTTTKSITNSITFLTNDPGHTGTQMEVNAEIIGNPVVHKDYTIIMQTGGTNDFSGVDFDLTLAEGQTVSIEEGVIFTSSKPISMSVGSYIRGNYVGEIIVPEGCIEVRSGEGDSLVITVYPEEDVHTITANVTPEDSGVVAGAGTYITGDEVTLTASANTGYRFVQWLESDDVVGTDPIITFVAASDRTLTAVFEEKTFEDITTTPENDFGYDNWYWVLMMLHNQEFDITASATEGGTITPAGISKVKYDKNITYIITPDEGYAIADVLVDGKSVGAVSEYTIKRIKEDHTISAIFVKTAWENPYTDVSKNAWYYEDIEFVSENGLMIGTGDNKFSPNAIVNRAMLVTVLWRLEGSPVADSPVDFYDVPADEWYTAAVNWAAANGIVNGYGDGIFGAMNDLTHEQIMAILNRYAVYKKWSENVSGNADDSYTNSEWAENNVLWADLNGMFDGIGSDISDLTEGADRAELAAYLRRFCERFMAE